jgi:hypothetical protein
MTDVLFDCYLHRKEIRDLRNFQRKGSKLWITPATLELSAVQLLAKREFNPSNNKTRLLLKLGPGVGKTLTSLQISLPYIKIFNIINQKLGKIHNVNIVGFTKNIFKVEFLKFPELNIITYDELHRLNNLKAAIVTATDLTREKIRDIYKRLKIKIVRRIIDPASGGLYSFMGFKELYNNLFVGGLPKDATESSLMDLYKSGKIEVNKILLERFKYSLTIGDEIHIAYNTENTNNYGLALQFLADYYGNSITMLFLTATIINNDKREIISIANLLRVPGSPHFNSSDFFSTSDKGKPYDASRLKPIYEQLKDRVIFLEETGTDYPELVFKGESYPGIKYLKFNIAKMSPLHEQTFALDNLYIDTTNKFNIMDMVYPNPEYSYDEHMSFHPDPSIASEHRKKVRDINRLNTIKGIYDNENCISLIRNASADWRSKFGISVKEGRNVSYLGGSFLKYDNLKLYSTKYCEMLDVISSTLKENPRAKFIIYHPYVRGTGIMTISEILSQNGYLSENGMVTGDTYSAEEYITYSEWSKKYPHREFHPARYFTVDFDVTESQKSDALDRWNSDKFGINSKFFIGAGRIEQSLDFKYTTVMIMVHKTKTMSSYIQIKGRAVRKKALYGMPPDMQKVYLHTLLSVGAKPNALEPRKYAKKIAEFDNIRQIEYNVNKNAINNYMFDDFKPTDILGALPYTNDNSKLPKRINSDNFYMEGYYDDTISEITKQIKRAFVSVPYWSYDNLFEFVKANSGVIDVSKDINLYNVSLKKLIYNKDTFVDNKHVLLFDDENTIINKRYIDGNSISCPNKVIMEFGDYFVLSTINSNSEIQVEPDMFFHDNYDMTAKYLISINHSDVIKTTAIDKLLNTVKDFTPARLESFSYVFLFSWPPEAHYIFMKDYLTNPKNKIPIVLINMYKKLKILSGEPMTVGSWYDEKYARYILTSKTEFKQGDKPVLSKKDNKPLVGIISNGAFKIRDSRNDSSNDGRITSRGIACTNINKGSVMGEYLEILGISAGSNYKTKSICNEILRVMIKKEINSRAGKDDVRYIYLFND